MRRAEREERAWIRRDNAERRREGRRPDACEWVTCRAEIVSGPGVVPTYDDVAFALTWSWCGGLITWLQFDIQQSWMDRDSRTAVYAVPLPAPLAWGLELLGSPVTFQSTGRGTGRWMSFALSYSTPTDPPPAVPAPVPPG